MPGPESRDSRTLGFASLLLLGINGMVGVGIFFTPAKVAFHAPGSSGVAVYLLTALCLLPVALAFATLGGKFPEDGGPYIWARAAFGPGLGFAVGWITYVSALFSASAVCSFLGSYLAGSLDLTGSGAVRAAAVGCVLVLTAVAATGLRPSAIAWNTVTVLKLIPLLVLAALFAVGSSAPAPPVVARSPSLMQLGQAALVVVFATQGFEIVPVPAGKARGSQRAVPLATVGSLGAVALLYVVLHAACVRALPGLADSKLPLVDAARVYGGASIGTLVAIGTGVSAVGIAFGMFAMTPRYLSVLGRADAFGEWLGHESPSRSVPHRALYVTTGCVLALVMAAGLTDLIAFSAVAVLTQYGVTTAALVAMAWRRQHGLRRWQLWPAPLALVAVVGIGQTAEASQLLVAAAVLLVGLVLLGVRRVFRRLA